MRIGSCPLAAGPSSIMRINKCVDGVPMDVYENKRRALQRLDLLGKARDIETRLIELQQEIEAIPAECTDEAYTAAVKSVQMFLVKRQRQFRELQR